MGFGNLDRRIDIQTGAETVTANGQRTTVWSSFHECWAGLDYGLGDEGYEADQLTASNVIKFKIRYFAGITEKMKLVYDSIDYDISHIAEIDRQRYLIIKAEKKD